MECLNQVKINKSLLGLCCWVTQNYSSKSKLSKDDILKVLFIAQTGLYTDIEEIWTDCLWSLANISETSDDEILGMIASGETLPKLIQLMDY